jgi:hypothetical protein
MNAVEEQIEVLQLESGHSAQVVSMRTEEAFATLPVSVRLSPKKESDVNGADNASEPA